MASRILVEVGDFVLASRDTYEDVAVPLSNAIDMLAGRLGGLGGVAGNDDIGSEFAARYDAATSAVLEALTGATNGCFRLSAMFAASGRNYETADVASTAAERPAMAALTATLPPPTRIGAAPVPPTSRRAALAPIPVLPGGGGTLGRAIFDDYVPNGSPDGLRSAAHAWRAAAEAVEGTGFPVAMLPTRFAADLLPEAEDMLAVCEGQRDDLQSVARAARRVADACDRFAAGLAEVQAELVGVAKDLVLSGSAPIGSEVKVLRAVQRYRRTTAAACAELVGVVEPCAAVSAHQRLLADAPLIEAGLAQVPYAPAAGVVPPDLAPTTRLASGYPITVLEDRHTALSLTRVPPDLRPHVARVLALARSGRVGFAVHDGKRFDDRKHRLPPGHRYSEWTLTIPGTGRGTHRLILADDKKNPTAIYYWDHFDGYVWIGP